MKRLIITFFISLSCLIAWPVAGYALDSKTSAQCGINQVAGKDDCTKPKGSLDIGNLLTNIINVVSLLVGAIAVIMIIVGGFRYVTSAGSDSATATARKTIIYALVGLIVAATAQVLVHFVLKNITNL